MTGGISRDPFRVARIDTTHGLRGEVSAAILTDFPERFAGLERVRVGRSVDDSELRRIESWRLHRGKVILALEGITDVDAARGVVGCDVWIEAADAVELPADAYYHRDLIGLRVEDRSGRIVGTVKDVLLTGGTDVLVVDSDGGEVLLPAARSICVEVDLEGGRIVVDPPDGLLELNAV